MRPSAASVWGLKLLVYAALSKLDATPLFFQVGSETVERQRCKSKQSKGEAEEEEEEVEGEVEGEESLRRRGQEDVSLRETLTTDSWCRIHTCMHIYSERETAGAVCVQTYTYI
jgi:hypothetical protein